MVCLRGCSAVPLQRKTSCVHTLLMVSISNISNNSSPWHPSDFQSVTLGSIKSYLYFFHGTNCLWSSKSWSEPCENEMRVVVLERKNNAAMKSGALHLLWSDVRFIPEYRDTILPYSVRLCSNVKWFGSKKKQSMNWENPRQSPKKIRNF